MGFFSGLNTEDYDRKYSDGELYRRIITYFRPHVWRLAGTVILLLVVAGMGAWMPIVVSRGVDAASIDPTVAAIYRVCLWVFTIGVVRWLANWLNRRFMIRIVANVMFQLAKDAFKSAADHDLSFYDEFSSGRILSRITSDTRDFGQLVNLTSDLISQVVQAVVLGVVLSTINWQLFLVVVVIVPIVFILAYFYRKLARKVTRQGMQAMAEVNATIKETISGIAVAKNFRQENSIYGTFTDANVMSYDVNVRRGRVLSLVFPTLNTLGGFATALLLYRGGLSAFAGIITAGNLYLFIMSLNRFLFPVMMLSSYMTQVQSGLAAAERVFALIDAEPVVVQNGTLKPGKLTGAITFDHVDFRYKDNEPVLDEFSLSIKAGENIALVGHTGAGKSSIAKLIARFYEFQSGRILIDGQDIRSLNLTSFRNQLGIVSQSPFLFSGTVMDNIIYACPDATEEVALSLAKQIGDGEWLNALPNGLETEVGERGAFLSMGQRQLVSLMRVLIQCPSIFILDEATASIDPFTEWQIQQALDMILKRSTSILIAHRLSTVKSADRIVVMDQGRIAEIGSHDSLMKDGGHYAELYNAYFRHQSLEYVEKSRAVWETHSKKIDQK
jgi:ATP-binding cassette, subfamily B, bacterial